VNTVVYYPHIWPRPEWLRLGALCWDRIVLLGVSLHGPSSKPDDIRELDDTLGGILDTSTTVTQFVDAELTDRFKRWVEPRADVLRAQLSDDPQTMFGVYDEKFISPAPGEEDIRDWLVAQGLARIEEPQNREEYGFDPEEGWFMSEVGASMFVSDTVVYLPKDIALHYLSLVAAKAAASNNRDLATDEAVFTDVVFDDVRGVRGSVASSTMEAFLPAGFDRIEPERLADIRTKLAAGRLEYQAEIQSTVEKFASVSSEAELDAVSKSIHEIAQARVEETRQTYRRSKLDLATQTFSVTLTPPALATSIASVLGIGIFAPAWIAAALGIFGARALLGLSRSRAERAKSPWSYVLDVGGAV
jgi:hypothetical protein